MKIEKFTMPHYIKRLGHLVGDEYTETQRNYFLCDGNLKVVREPGDKKYTNTFHDETQLWYDIKCKLREMGHDVIKRNMEQDGHMMGSVKTYYIRDRKRRYGIIDNEYAIRFLNEEWNEHGEVDLAVTSLIGDEKKSVKAWGPLPEVS